MFQIKSLGLYQVPTIIDANVKTSNGGGCMEHIL